MQNSSAISVFMAWYDSLPVRKDTGGPARGTVGAALVVPERLKDCYDLSLGAHRTPGGAQVQGASRAAVERILAGYGETRRYLREGSRTNRGALGFIEKLLLALDQANLNNLHTIDRNDVLIQL